MANAKVLSGTQLNAEVRRVMSETAPVVEPPSLADQINAAKARAAQVVEAEAQRIKASEEGRQLPIDWIRLNIRAIARAGSCDCKCALSILSERESNG
jgi:hypothetical protein